MEHLTEVLLGLKKFLDSRTAMMQAMYRRCTSRLLNERETTVNR